MTPGLSMIFLMRYSPAALKEGTRTLLARMRVHSTFLALEYAGKSKKMQLLKWYV